MPTADESPSRRLPVPVGSSRAGARTNSPAARNPAAIDTSGGDEERHRTFEDHDLAQHRKRYSAESQQAERALAFAETSGDAHRQAASGEEQADQDDHVGELLVLAL